jgi:S1-C subfamily serine protease
MSEESGPPAAPSGAPAAPSGAHGSFSLADSLGLCTTSFDSLASFDSSGSSSPGPERGPGGGPDHAAAVPHPYPADLLGEDLPGGGRPGGGGPAAWRLTDLSLITVTLVIALAAALIGGLAGGFIVSRSSGSGGQPNFSLGKVSPAVTDRPPTSVAGVVARVLPSVVMVKVNGSEGNGSGFVVTGGYIVTDNHVVTLDGQVSNASLQVVLDGGRQMNAKLVGRDPFSDIAVIKPDNGTGLPALPLGNSDSVQVGDPVIAIGSPLGLAETVTSGIVSALHRPIQPGAGAGAVPQVFYDAIQTDAPINPGNSGGPLVNDQGQVIGVDAAIDTLGSNPATGTQGGSIGLGFAIPINQVRIVATELIRTGHAAHAVIGALINVDYRGTGAQVLTSRAKDAHTIMPGGPAARAGLRPGDVIVRFGGQPITSAGVLLDAIRSRQPGTRVSVTFTRHGMAHTVMLTLGSATA